MEDDKLDEGETSKKFKERLETHPNLTKQLVFSSDLGGGHNLCGPGSVSQAGGSFGAFPPLVLL